MTYRFGKLNSKLRASQCAYFITRIYLLGSPMLLPSSPESAVDWWEGGRVDWRFLWNRLRMMATPADPRHTHTHTAGENHTPPLTPLQAGELATMLPSKIHEACFLLGSQTPTVSRYSLGKVTFPLGPGSSTVPCCRLSYGQPCDPKQAAWEASAGV